MSRSYLFVIAVLSLSMFAQEGLSQTVNVTDGINTFNWNVTQTSANVTQTLGGVPGSDIQFEEGWFLIVGGQVTRLANTNPANITVSGNNTSSANISYSSVALAGEIFDIDLGYQVGSSSSGSINLGYDVQLSVQSNANGPVSGSIVNYFDYDIDGFQNQIGSFSNSPVATITQVNPTTGSTFSRSGPGADAFDIASFAGLRTDLENGILLDSTPVLTPIDVTAAFQWDFVVEPGKDFVFNGAGVEVVAVPEPSMMGMMSFLGGMVFLRRSRRRG